ncbi:MAG: MFS transporter [Propionibacteriaceae bacterium]
MTASPPDPQRPPVPYRISLGVGMGSLLQPLNSSMIAVALVTIATELSIDSGISWLISALYLATAVAAPTAGRLADLYGARKVFFVGLVLVAVGGALGPLLPSLPGLIIARVVLGLGTAAQYPSAMAIIRARAERRREDASKALAVLGVCAQVSVAFGPTLGGLLVTGLGWRSIFWINIVLALIAGLWVWRATDPADQPVLPAAEGESLWSRLDVPGLALFATFLTFVMLFLMSLVDTPSWWWLIAALPVGAGLLWRELRARQPFLDVRMLSGRPRLLVVFARQLLVSTAFYSVFYVLPQWLEGVRDYSPEQSGLLVVPVAAVGVVSTLVASAWIRHGGLVPTLLIGNVGLIGAGVLIALTLTLNTPWWGFLLVAALLGIPNGFNNMANQNELYGLAGTEIGAASGLLRTTQYVGANLSAAMIEVLVGGSITDGGLHRVGWGIAVVSVLLLLVTLAGLGLRSRPAR